MFVVVLALGQLLFFWNVTQTLRGKAGAATFDERGIPVPARRPPWSPPTVEAVLVLATLVLALGVGAGGYLVGRESGGGGETVTVTAGESSSDTTESTVAADAEAGATVFTSAGCSGCHAFTPAGSTGQVGPNLDGTGLSADEVAALVTTGRGAMPAFGERLSEQEISDVAAFVTAR